DDDGNVVEIHCTYDPETKGGHAPDGRRVKATLHWVSAEHAVEAEARLYNHLFTEEVPDGDDEKDFTEFINPESVEIIDPVYIEPAVKSAKAGDRFQFERLAYYVVDPDSTDEKLVFNRTVTLRDRWKKEQAKQKKGKKNKKK
ncbi:MAG: glutamine--tRNA ligase, partial [Chloroflexota bacterium]